MNRKKFLTRLLDGKYRRRVVASMSEPERARLGVRGYAKYVVDRAVGSRNTGLEKCRACLYGFQPLEAFAYVRKDGSLVTRLFEMNSVSHFLVLGDADSAVEVAEAMLVDWAKSLDDIGSFDVGAIDGGLKKLEAEYLASAGTGCGAEG